MSTRRGGLTTAGTFPHRYEEQDLASTGKSIICLSAGTGWYIEIVGLHSICNHICNHVCNHICDHICLSAGTGGYIEIVGLHSISAKLTSYLGEVDL
jgi:hypothetical protein